MAIIVPLITPCGNWSSGWKSTWDEAHDLTSANYEASSSPQASSTRGSTTFLIKRGVFTADLSSVPSETIIERAKLYLEYVGGRSEANETIYAVIVDGTGVPLNDGGYDEMEAKTAWLASIAIPPYTYWGGETKEIHFNGAGITALQAAIGGTLQLGLRMDHDISDTEPPTNAERYFNWALGYDMWIVLNWQPGYIWVKGTKIAYIDYNGDKRTKEGTTTGQTGTVAGHLWVEGDYLHYIDASLDERKILGSTTGLSGKTAGQISINTEQGGTKFCYIDSSGNERCFEGTAS